MAMGGKKPLPSLPFSLSLSISVSLSRRPRRNCLTRRSYRSCVFPLAILFSHPTSSAFTVEKGNLTGSKTPSGRTSFTSPAALYPRRERRRSLSRRETESQSACQPASQPTSHPAIQPSSQPRVPASKLSVATERRATSNIKGALIASDKV